MKKKLYMTATVLCLVVFLTSMFMIGYHVYQAKHAVYEFEELVEIVGESEENNFREETNEEVQSPLEKYQELFLKIMIWWDGFQLMVQISIIQLCIRQIDRISI